MERGYRIEIKGFPPYLYTAESRGKARMKCARDIAEAWDCTIATALKNIKRVVLATPYELDNIGIDREILSTDRDKAKGGE